MTGVQTCALPICLLESDFGRIASAAGLNPEGIRRAVDQVVVTLKRLGDRLTQRATLGPGFAVVGGTARPLPKWGVKINWVFDRVEAVATHREPRQDGDSALHLARRIAGP